MMHTFILLILLSGCTSIPRYEGLEEAKRMIAPGDLKAIEWLFSNQVIYFRDYSPQDEYRDADKTIKLGLADCDDYYMVTCAIVNSWRGWLCNKNLKDGGGHVTATVIGPDVLGEFDNGEWKSWI